MNTLESEVIHS